LIFSLYDFDATLIRAIRPDVPNRKFIGILGQFIPLSTSICDYINTKGTNCETENVDSKMAVKEGTSEKISSEGSYQLPSREAAFNELFGAFDPSGKVKTASDKLTSFWFERLFKYGNDDIHVKFFKSQTLDASGKVEDCHACGVDIGAITYKKIDNQWQVISRQTVFGAAGEYGDQAESSPEIIRLSSNVIALMLDSKSGGMGYYYEGKMLLTFSDNTWHHAGIINTAANNSADCEDKEREMPCWSYEGKMSVVAGVNAGYPNILVTRTGTDENITPVKNVTYAFKDATYTEIQ